MKLAKFLNSLFIKNGFILIDADSNKYKIGNPKKENPITLRLLDRSLHSKLLFHPDLYFGEAYSNGAVVIDGGVGIAKTLNVGEDVVAFASSDERYKDLITPIENPNEKIKLLSGNTFVWNDKHEVFKGKKDIGVIAQEVEKVLPEIVETREDGYKAVRYEKIIPLLIECIKDLSARVKQLEGNDGE